MEKGTPKISVLNAGRQTKEATAWPEPSDENRRSGGKEEAWCFGLLGSCGDAQEVHGSQGRF